MKFSKLTGIIGAAHVGAITLFLLQSGCTSSGITDPQVSRVSSMYMNETDDIAGNREATADSHDYDLNQGFDIDAEVEDCQPTHVAKRPPTRPKWNLVSNAECRGQCDGVIRPIVTGQTAGAESVTYKVTSGDSLWVIARRNGTSVQSLADANGLNKKAVLRVGQELVIPGRQPITAPNADGGTYKIASGDTLSTIAARFKVTVSALRQVNGIQGNTIYAGKTLRIPGVNQSTVNAAPVARASTPRPMNSEGGYVVQRGDSLSVIARRFGVSVSDLMTWNGIEDAKKLRAGSTLRVGASSTKPMAEPKRDAFEEMESMLSGLGGNETIGETDSFDDLFDDDSLFDTSEEIPVVSVMRE